MKAIFEVQNEDNKGLSTVSRSFICEINGTKNSIIELKQLYHAQTVGLQSRIVKGKRSARNHEKQGTLDQQRHFLNFTFQVPGLRQGRSESQNETGFVLPY